MSAEGFNEVIHQSTRLRIMATLHAQAAGEPLEFVQLKSIIATTNGNLGTHLTPWRRRVTSAWRRTSSARSHATRITLTRSGRQAFERHVAYLRDTLEGLRPAG